MPSRIEAPLQLWGRNNRNYLELRNVRDDVVEASSLITGTQCTLVSCCRRVIRKIITLDRLDDIDKLPLPTCLKQFLKEPNCIQDFDMEMPRPAPTDENITFFIRHFHFHPNHLGRQIHVFPTVSTIDETNVIIQTLHMENCNTCDLNELGDSALDRLECFKKVKHENIQSFYGMLSGSELASTTFVVLERTKASFFHILVNVAAEEAELIPEEVLWGFFTQVARAVQYLQRNLNLLVPVMTRSFLVDYNGRLKLENPLGKSHRNLASLPRHIFADSHMKEFQVLWSMGCVLYNIATLLTLEEDNHFMPEVECNKVKTKCPSERCDCFTANYQQNYSLQYASMLRKCLATEVDNGFTIEELCTLTEDDKSNGNLRESVQWLGHYFMGH